MPITVIDSPSRTSWNDKGELQALCNCSVGRITHRAQDRQDIPSQPVRGLVLRKFPSCAEVTFWGKVYAAKVVG